MILTDSLPHTHQSSPQDQHFAGSGFLSPLTSCLFSCLSLSTTFSLPMALPFLSCAGGSFPLSNLQKWALFSAQPQILPKRFTHSLTLWPIDVPVIPECVYPTQASLSDYFTNPSENHTATSNFTHLKLSHSSPKCVLSSSLSRWLVPPSPFLLPTDLVSFFTPHIVPLLIPLISCSFFASAPLWLLECLVPQQAERASLPEHPEQRVQLEMGPPVSLYQGEQRAAAASMAAIPPGHRGSRSDGLERNDCPRAAGHLHICSRKCRGLHARELLGQFLGQVGIPRATDLCCPRAQPLQCFPQGGRPWDPCCSCFSRLQASEPMLQLFL